MDEGALKSLISSYLTPLTTAALWVIPSACVLYCLVQGVRWYMSDPQEQQQQPIAKKLKTAIVLAIVLESLSAILRIFGINA